MKKGISMAKRKWKRWVLMGKLNLNEMVEIARKQGMIIISGSKVSMCVHYQIGLYGTSAQMKQTEGAWIESGHKVTNRQPGYAFSCDVDIPRSGWVDKQR